MANSGGDTDRVTRRGSLRLFLSLVMVALLTAMSTTLVGIAYFRSRDSALVRVEENMRSFSDRLAARLEVLSGNTAALVGMVASVPNSFLSKATERMSDKVTVLREVIEHSRDIESAYAGYPDGSFFHVVNLASSAWRKALGSPSDAKLAVRLFVPTGSGGSTVHTVFFDTDGKRLPEEKVASSSYDPRARPWYIKAVDRSQPVATGPYEMATTGAFGMTISQAHEGNRKIVIGADVVLQRLLDFFTQAKMTPGTTAFLVNADSKLVIHSDQTINARILAARTERDFDQSILSDPLLRKLKAEPPVADKTSFVDVEGRTFVVMVTPIKSKVLFSGDRLVIAAPLDELMVSAREGFLQGLAIAALVVALAILCALVVAHLITKSLYQLTESANRFHNFDFKTPIDVSSRVHEISTLSNAMNKARDAILTFTLYVPKEFVRKGIESGHFAGRSARRQEVTAMFTDIYDFTSISEQHSPEHVVAMLSEYFDILNESVEAHGGTIIQFLGDSIFAMWNAPVADPRHAENACRGAIEMNRRLKIFNDRQRSRNLPEFRTRCGIHTGMAVVGSVGATDRLQYTAMGDTINVASRLEGINKTYGTSILASAAVVAECEDKSLFKPLGQAVAKGRTGALDIFEVIDVDTAKHA
ncbi:adenylate/guanylate cyclase domain-containing protein [Rhizobium sp. KVB221]|uniref:Adenylate/guanylate cyclase domain-containing protein n=1 Tax=Rhizobium setariae TaxID=2801340 RepID=A0A936YKX1_9HYPH|nr:adenylate/guanylate cyclase domain-containing protein [Rhizobium setariae]MBL0372299.1 adenylate/guanylate cyclase domain-containing protein [Rhizobium setariae]